MLRLFGEKSWVVPEPFLSYYCYTEQQNIPGLLLFVDFEKAFDSLEWPFIEKTLTYYNFGISVISWIKLFYTDISSSIQNNGWASEFFPLGRGVRQGCPLSPYLFVPCAEILGTAIRNHKQIKGIRILDEECKVYGAQLVPLNFLIKFPFHDLNFPFFDFNFPA